MDYKKRFVVTPGSRVALARIDPALHDGHPGRESAQTEMETYRQKLEALQFRMYAEKKRSLLICLQALDAGGKDGVIRHVLGAMNPQGCSVVGFKQPSVEEASHDFLWRAHKAVPERGHVAIFNRSHYEDVLVTRVHGLISKSECIARYARINEFEKLLSQGHTHILKFFLHISEDEQLRRFKQRIDDPTRHWKISENDYTERAKWKKYIAAFDDGLSSCSTAHAPWFIIPSNHKWFRDLAVSRIIVEVLEGLSMQFPDVTVDLRAIKEKYHAEATRSRRKSKAQTNR